MNKDVLVGEILWRRGVIVITTAQIHKFIHRSLKSSSAQAQILLAVCWSFAMVRISDNGSGGK